MRHHRRVYPRTEGQKMDHVRWPPTCLVAEPGASQPQVLHGLLPFALVHSQCPTPQSSPHEFETHDDALQAQEARPQMNDVLRASRHQENNRTTCICWGEVRWGMPGSKPTSGLKVSMAFSGKKAPSTGSCNETQAIKAPGQPSAVTTNGWGGWTCDVSPQTTRAGRSTTAPPPHDVNHLLDVLREFHLTMLST
mmetsp:Transcript_24640/g.52531  ORF Transcript_24640/g.52531 Transcript_24640/m.52531 type:complete len:194 (+) Transcript_24640:659-1240(+)